MKSQHASKLIGMAIGLTLTATSVSAHDSKQIAQLNDKPTIGVTQLNSSLAMLSGVDGFTGGNVVVSNGPDGMLIIDDKLPTMTRKLTAVLNDMGGVDKLKFVLNTHWHLDHSGGNRTLGADAIIVAHDNVRKRLSSPQKINFFNADIPAQPASALPVITYADGLSIHFNGEEISVKHFPNSHTDTDSVIYFNKSNVLHTGDLFFNGLFPFVDSQNGGDIKILADSIATILKTFPADATIVPGHGGLATMDDLKTYLQMLNETTSAVETLIAEGKSLEEIKAAGVSKKWESWAWRIEPGTWNSLIYSSLTK